MPELAQSWVKLVRRQDGGLRNGLLVFLISTAVGLFFTGQIYFSAAGAGHAVSGWQALYWALGDWYEWALLSPLIFWLCRAYPLERPRWGRSVAFHVMAGVILSIFHAGLCAAAAVLQGWVTHAPVAFDSAWGKLLTTRIHFNLAVYGLIVAAWHAWNFYRGLREREQMTAELTAKLNQAQLQALRMQLNPHFLFNTLNAVSSLLLKDANAANTMIVRLSELLRIALSNSTEQEVPLSQEMSFLRRYLEIQEIRFGDRLTIDVQVDPATLQAAVPNLILQPLVENAIVHAIESRESDGRIELRSVRANGSLLLSVSDNGPSADSDDCERSGDRAPVGLNNTRERLAKLYGEAQQFQLSRNHLGGVTASLTLPFRTAVPSL